MTDIRCACPQCGQHLECDASYGGSELDCPTCSARMVVPAAREASPGQQPTASLERSCCPGCGTSLAAGTKVCITCGFNTATGTRLQTQVSSQRRRFARDTHASEKASSSPSLLKGTVLTVVVLFLLGMISGPVAGIYLVSVWLLSVVVGLLILITAFRDDILQGLATLLIPFYGLYYVFVRNQEPRLKFSVILMFATVLSLLPLSIRWASELAEEGEGITVEWQAGME